MDQPSRRRHPDMSDDEFRSITDKDKAETASAREAWWRTRGPRSAEGGGALLDAQIAALDARLDSVEGSVDSLEDRVEVLESGETPEPPDPPEPEPGDKLYPDENDPMCGVPAGTALTSSGSLNVTEANKVIEGLNINGTITVKAKGVTIRNCRITSSGYTIVSSRQGADFEMHHCEIIGNSSGQNGFDGTGHIHHCRIDKCENPINIAGDGAVIEWNDIHNLTGPSSAHKDGIQADGDIEGLIIRNNRIDNKTGETSAVMLDNYWGPIRNVEVTENFLGGGSFPAYLDGSFNGSQNATDIAYRRNVMRKGGWGTYFYHDSAGTHYTREDNVDYQTGANVDDK